MGGVGRYSARPEMRKGEGGGGMRGEGTGD